MMLLFTRIVCRDRYVLAWQALAWRTEQATLYGAIGLNAYVTESPGNRRVI
jgi:hypothetical protein